MASQTRPAGVLLCDPLYFDVIDVKNPFMAGSEPVDKARARIQWSHLADAFRATGAEVDVIPGMPGCEDMVFTANTALTGVDATGRKRAVIARMAHESRQREIEPTISALDVLGYSTHELPGNSRFEGGGDGVWHLGRHRLFAGSGSRSEPDAYGFVKEIFGCEVVPLTLRTPQFYHLDTCLCVVDERTALIYAPAVTEESYAAVSRYFDNLIDVDHEEALRFACNACSIRGSVIIEQSAAKTIERLRTDGYNVVPVDTSEFMKSGGSVYCMKQYLF